jgi:hypothetical protein
MLRHLAHADQMRLRATRTTRYTAAGLASIRFARATKWLTPAELELVVLDSEMRAWGGPRCLLQSPLPDVCAWLKGLMA